MTWWHLCEVHVPPTSRTLGGNSDEQYQGSERLKHTPSLCHWFAGEFVVRITSNSAQLLQSLSSLSQLNYFLRNDGEELAYGHLR